MRYTLARLAIVAALAVPLWASQAATGAALFEQALAKERIDGNLPAAIALYEQVVRESAADRALAARALVQIGLCYEKLGRDEARRAYERLIREFADQKDAVDQARTRLAALQPPAIPSTAMTTRQLWAGPAVDTTGTPSPDGRFLSFVDWETGDLALRDLTTGQNRRLTSKGTWADSADFAETSAISPDGRQIAYGWYTNGRYELRVSTIEATKPRTLVASPDVAYVQVGGWTGDGSKVLVALGHENGGHELVLVSVSDGAVQSLKRFADWRWPDRATVSPDGRLVAYELANAEPGGTRDIFLVDVARGSETRLTDHPANDRQPTWTPDGHHLLFLSDRTGTMAAWLLEIRDGKPAGAPRLLKPDMARATPMGFTRAGTLVYASPSGLRDVYVAELDARQPRLVSPPAIAVQEYTGGNRNPDWSPDGSQIVYLSQRDLSPSGAGENLLCIAPAAGGRPDSEYRLPFRNVQRPRWSPDGRSFLVTGLLRGQFGVFQIDRSSHAVTPLKVRPGLGSMYAAAWWPDGRSILFSQGLDDRTVVIRRFLDTGREQVLLSIPGGGGGDATPSPDGRFVAVRAWEPGAKPGSVIKIVAADGGAARDLVRGSIPAMGGIAWTPDGRYVLYLQSPEATRPTELWRADVSSGETQAIGLGLPKVQDLRLAPDGRHVLFGGGEWRNEVWALENALPRPAPAARR